MLLFYSKNSPYARIARVAARETGIISLIEERPALNRDPQNPVLQFNPGGRVPTLVADDLVLTEAKTIYAYICSRSKKERALTWEYLAIEGQVTALVDAVAALIREGRRDPVNQSIFLVKVDLDRINRCLDHLNEKSHIAELNRLQTFAGIALACGLELLELHRFLPNWRHDSPELFSWMAGICDVPSMRSTRPSI